MGCSWWECGTRAEPPTLQRSCSRPAPALSPPRAAARLGSGPPGLPPSQCSGRRCSVWPPWDRWAQPRSHSLPAEPRTPPHLPGPTCWLSPAQSLAVTRASFRAAGAPRQGPGTKVTAS